MKTISIILFQNNTIILIQNQSSFNIWLGFIIFLETIKSVNWALSFAAGFQNALINKDRMLISNHTKQFIQSQKARYISAKTVTLFNYFFGFIDFPETIKSVNSLWFSPGLLQNMRLYGDCMRYTKTRVVHILLKFVDFRAKKRISKSGYHL